MFIFDEDETDKWLQNNEVFFKNNSLNKGYKEILKSIFDVFISIIINIF